MAYKSLIAFIAILGTTSSQGLITDSSTCAYTSGSAGLPVLCPSPGYCNYFTSYSTNNFGCNGAGGYVSACLDYHADGNYNEESGPMIRSERFMCGSVQPYCTTLKVFGTTTTTDAVYPIYSFGCQAGVGATYIAYQTTFAPTSTTSSSSTISTTSTAVAQTSQTLPTATATSSESSPQTSSQSSSGISTSASAGIGVGVGIAALLLAIGLVLWFWRRRRASRSPTATILVNDQNAYEVQANHGSLSPAKSSPAISPLSEMYAGREVHELPSRRP